jgi:hypothetical protein
MQKMLPRPIWAIPSQASSCFPSPWARRGRPPRPEQRFKQFADLLLPDERVTQGKLRHDLVAISPAPSLAQHVARVDEVGQDLVGGALGDADGGGDVAQPNARVMGDARKDVGVVRQEVPVGRPGRPLLLVSGS